MPRACVLISDITGSTPLYEREGAAAAMGYINTVLTRMREIVDAAGGQSIKSKGDDVLCLFSEPDKAAQAAWQMINEDWPMGLSLHSGLYQGDVVQQDGDAFGDAVNTAARLAALAKPGEILLGGPIYEALTPALRNMFVLISELQLRGKEAPTKAYACSVVTLSAQTVIGIRPGAERASRTESASFTLGDRTWQIGEGDTLTLGRATDCHIVLDQAWVSRSHAALTVRNAQLEFTDHSSTGSVVRTADGNDMTVHRRTTC